MARSAITLTASEISFADSSTAGNATIVLANGLLEMGSLSPESDHPRKRDGYK